MPSSPGEPDGHVTGPVTNGDVIADALGELGVRRVYGSPLGDLPVVDPGDPDLTFLLADTDGRMGNGWGAAFVDGQILHLSSQPGGTARPRTITGIDGLVAALVEAELDAVPRTLAFELDLDLDAPVDEDLDLSGRPDGGVLVTLSPSLADLAIVAVVGPGVGRGETEALAEFAARGGIGVYNTWGAKGVFRWDSPFHYGTIGLQAHDLDLAELGSFDLVIASGLDPDEFGIDALAGFLVQEVAPWQIGALLADWPRAVRSVDHRPPLYDTIASVVTPMYEQESGPVTPPRAALQLSGAAPDHAVIAADPGTAGFWIARTFPTGVPGSVVVPALRQPGFAVAAGIVAGLDGRPCVSVVDGPLDDASEAALEVARRLGVSVSVQVWEPGDTSADDHLHLTRAGFAAAANGSVRIDTVGVDATCLEVLTDAVGPVTAWQHGS